MSKAFTILAIAIAIFASNIHSSQEKRPRNPFKTRDEIDNPFKTQNEVDVREKPNLLVKAKSTPLQKDNAHIGETYGQYEQEWEREFALNRALLDKMSVQCPHCGIPISKHGEPNFFELNQHNMLDKLSPLVHRKYYDYDAEIWDKSVRRDDFDGFGDPKQEQKAKEPAQQPTNSTFMQFFHPASNRSSNLTTVLEEEDEDDDDWEIEATMLQPQTDRLYNFFDGSDNDEVHSKKKNEELYRLYNFFDENKGEFDEDMVNSIRNHYLNFLDDRIDRCSTEFNFVTPNSKSAYSSRSSYDSNVSTDATKSRKE